MTRGKPPSGVYLGADVGATKTSVFICDGEGRLLGSGLAGCGNPERVGYKGLTAALKEAAAKAIAESHREADEISAAGFGIGGFDWDSQEADMRAAVEEVGLQCPLRLVNDTLLGLLAGAEAGWGVAVVSGTGCNCWGWNHDRTRIGRVTGGGTRMGEFAGGTELVERAIRHLAYAWTGRGPESALADLLVSYAGAHHLADLLEGLMDDRYTLNASAAPLIFRAALAGDTVAAGLVEWAGSELGEMANAVIRQLGFQDLEFEIVTIGSLFKGEPPLAEPIRRAVLPLAPRARLSQLGVPPAAGAVLLAMELAGSPPTPAIRNTLVRDSRTRA